MNDPISQRAAKFENWRKAVALGSVLMAVPSVWVAIQGYRVSAYAHAYFPLLWGFYCGAGFAIMVFHITTSVLPASRRKDFGWFVSAAFNGLGVLLIIWFQVLMFVGNMYLQWITSMFVSGLYLCYLGAVAVISAMQALFQRQLLNLAREEAEREAIAREVADQARA
jgi:hypothetical protein